nr:hypothetical protein [Tanacetum cinerariifolium]
TSPPVLPTFEDLEDSLIMGNEDLSTILEKESDEFIKFSVDDLDPIPRKEIDHLDALPDSVQSLPIRANSIIFLIEDDSLMKEIDIFLALDDSIPPGMENDDYDSEGDVFFLKELLNDDSISLTEYESFHVDFYNVSASPRPPKKPPDDYVYFDIEPDTEILTTKVVDDISYNLTRELYVHA